MIFAQKLATHTWAMIAEMGPYLLLGFAISALLQRILRTAWIEKLMGGKTLRSILWGSVVGVPMPLCSCGVIPVTMSLRSKGASRGATVSFLTSTPQTGVDSILASYAALGPIFAIYRTIVAFLSGIVVGLAAQYFAPANEKTAAPQAPAATPAPQPSWPESLRYGLITMPGDLSKSLFFGFLLAGLISALAPDDMLGNIPGGTLAAVLIATLISVPFYICSTGSIPLALALVQSGLPLPAALVLLIAGPATNAATITTMRQVLGGRTTLVYVAGVILTAWIAAAGFALLPAAASELAHSHLHHMDALPLWKHLGGIGLVALLVFPHLLPKKTATPMSQSPSETQHTLKISGMSCSHCEASVQRALEAQPSIQTVLAVDNKSSTATIAANTLDEPTVKAAIEALGFAYHGSQPK